MVIRSAWPLLIGVLVLILMEGCGGGGDGGGGGQPATTGAVSGKLVVPPGNILEAEPNNSISQPQVVTPPLVIAGGAANNDAGLTVTAPSGPVRIHDFYRVTAHEPIRAVLTIAQDDLNANDLDLVLLNSNGAFLDASETTDSASELLETSGPGTFLIGIRAFQGGSAYTLSIAPLSTLSSNAGTDILPPGASFVPGEVVVKRRPGLALSALDNFASQHGLQHKQSIPLGVEIMEVIPREVGFQTRQPLQSPVGRNPELKLNLPTSEENGMRARTYDAVRRLRMDPEVEYAHPNFLLKSMAVPNDAGYRLQWHYPLISLPEAWDVTTGSNNIIVAVIDTGVVKNHPDLQGRLIQGWDFISSPTQANDGNGIDNDPEDAGDNANGIGNHSYHGTHVAGTIGAATNNGNGVAGVTWQTRIMPIRVLGIKGGTNVDIAQGIRYAAGLPNVSGTVPAQRAHIINMSLGGCSPDDTSRQAVEAARNAGVIIVAASGNDRQAKQCPRGALNYPASYDGVISVAAVDINQRVAYYSSFGRTVDVAAPGGDTVSGTDVNGDGRPDGVLSTFAADDFLYYQGTSMASPHIAGVFSLMLAVQPSLTTSDISQLLAGTHPRTTRRITKDLGISGRDDDYGHGLINAAQAVRAAQEVSSGGPSPGGPILSVSTTILNFENFLSSLPFSVSNAGSGTLQVTGITDNAPWLTATPTSGTAPFNITAKVDRSGLASGNYTGQITIASNATQGSQITTVQVTMQVGGISTGDVGTVFVLLLDKNTLATVAQADVTASQNYAYTAPPAPPGSYIVVAGTDRDDNDFICEDEDACGLYPELVTVTPGGRTAGIDFEVANFFINPQGLVSELAHFHGTDLKQFAPAAGQRQGLRFKRLH